MVHRIRSKVQQWYSEASVFLKQPTRQTQITDLIQRAMDLQARYKQSGEIDDLDKAITLGREAVSRCPYGHPHRPISLNNLAIYLSSQYNLLGKIDDLNEAITLDQEALLLRPHGHPDRSVSLNNLAIDLSSRYKQLGKINDLNDAIDLAREALSLRLPGHPDRSTSLNNLANRLSSRYKLLGEIDDLNEAVALGREALALRPPKHPGRSISLYNLAIDLSSQFKLLGGINNINEVIILDQEALSLHPSGHPYRSSSLNNLANHLFFRYDLSGQIDDLNEAIVLDQDALSLHPPGHSDRWSSLNNFASHLSFRYKLLGGIDDLNKAIVLDQEALLLCPPGHSDRWSLLNNFASHLSSRYKLVGEIDDLDEAVAHNREALTLCPPGHSGRSLSLTNLAAHLSYRWDLPKGVGDINAAIEDKKELFSLYMELEHVSKTPSSDDLYAAKAWINTAEKFNHPTTLLAYETTLRLLVRYLVALLSLSQHLDHIKSLSSSLAVDAFSACLRNDSPTKAAELLEQGRSIFWGQLTRHRSPPLDNVISFGPKGKVLAVEYSRLNLLARNALNSASPDQHERVCHLNLELQRVVSTIHELPGLSRFILPPSFSDLQHAAKDGPVIIMNASEYSCDALIILSDRDPVHIPLPITKEGVRGLSSRLRTLTRVAKWVDMKDMEEEFKIFLSELWDKLVSPVMNVLQGTCPHDSRIWWCPTAEFSLLPLHAAAPHQERQKGVSDLYVSSYTTTLASLIHTRRPSLADSARGRKRFIGISHTAAKDTRELFSAGTELDNISQVVKGLATFSCIKGEDSCISTVADGLNENEWVHFTCHAVPDQGQPFRSAFAFHDGGFAVPRIAQCNLQSSEFAYLSCHTNVIDRKSPDEVVHLASAMHFAGFRSVIGTLWTVDGSQTNEVISTFYKLMINESGFLDYTRAAHALQMTMKKVNIPIDQRILYIHFGA